MRYKKCYETWQRFKAHYQNHLVLIRLGDFYETFDNDAALLAETNDMILVSIPGTDGERIPMCGFLYYRAEREVATLLRVDVKIILVDPTTPADLVEVREHLAMERAADAAWNNGGGIQNATSQNCGRANP